MAYSFDNDEIVQLCQPDKVLPSNILSNESSGRRVIRLTDGVVVKFGLGVTLQEASIQQLAFQTVDSDVLRIPQVHHFFSRSESKFGPIGYLVMENIDGVTLERVRWEEKGILSRVVTALNALHSISSKHPGPISGGEAYGSLWSESGSGTTFDNIKDLEFYMNERLVYFQTSIRVREEDLCLCHLDVAPRNFMIDLQGRLCLLDWATAGFFPRYFELWSINFTQHVMGRHFGPELIQMLEPTTAEESEVEKLSLIYRFNSNYAM